MKTLYTLLFSLCLTGLMAQGSVKGTIVDADDQEALIGASVLIQGTTTGTITDIDGTFELVVLEPGDYVLQISYTGYSTLEINVAVGDGESDLGTYSMESSAIGLAEVEVIASLAIDRKTPVAVTTISGEKVEALVGNQEYVEILRKTPSIYVTKAGGGFGDSRINVRGFDQRNTAVMINGIPVNDMENGWVYWSNWAGLADVTSSLQVQRGLGATKLAVAAVGGSINIVTNAADQKKGGAAGVSIGNDGYQKYSLSLSTGLGDKGWAFTMQGTHTLGNGYIQGTKFKAWSYYLAITKQFNANNMLSFTVLGAPQWHHQRNIPGSFDKVTLRTFVDPEDGSTNPDQGLGTKFNWLHGDLNGEEFTFRRNFYHKPKMFVNWYLNLSPKTDLKTSAYVSLGRGGGTGPRGRLRTTEGSIFDSFGGRGKGIHDENGHTRFNDLYNHNQGQLQDGWGDDPKQVASTGDFMGSYVNTRDGKFEGSGAEGSGFIRRASMNYHDWYGVLSTLTTELSDNFTFIGGVDARYYKGEHFRRLENLLNADAYYSQSDKNGSRYLTEESPATFGNFFDNSYKDADNPNVLAYHNDGLVTWLGLFGQVEYTKDRLSAFVALSGSNQGFKRIDYFNYLESDPDRETDWQNFLGGTVKGGVNFNIDERNNVFINGGYYSRQPIFDNVFINFRNDLSETVKNQTVVAFEAGYGYRSQSFDAKVNAYYMQWANRQFGRTIDVLNDAGEEVEVQFQFENVTQQHIGLEVEMQYRISRRFSLNGMLSVGDWKYTDNFSAKGTDLDTGDEYESTIFADGLEVGDAAQTTFNIGLNWEFVRNFSFYGDFYHAARLFAQYDVNDKQFEEPGGNIVQVPNYSLVDMGLSYKFDLGNSLRAVARFNMNNVLDEVYVSDLVTNIEDDPNTPENEFYNNRGVYGFGRTWNVGFKLYF